MKKLLLTINKSLSNPRSFWVGFFLLLIMIFIIVLMLTGHKFRAYGTSSSHGGNPFILLITGLPSIFLIAYGLKPKSKLGIVGSYFYKIYQYLFQK